MKSIFNKYLNLIMSERVDERCLNYDYYRLAIIEKTSHHFFMKYLLTGFVPLIVLSYFLDVAHLYVLSAIVLAIGIVLTIVMGLIKCDVIRDDDYSVERYQIYKATNVSDDKDSIDRLQVFREESELIADYYNKNPRLLKELKDMYAETSHSDANVNLVGEYAIEQYMLYKNSEGYKAKVDTMNDVNKAKIEALKTIRTMNS